MAREHARFQTNIWIDDDFLDLSKDAQHLYFVIVSQMKLSFCGVIDWHPGRLTQLAAGWSKDEVNEAAAELSERLYLVFDEDTDEVLVRSFIRSDGLLTSPNISKAMFRAFSQVSSRTLRGVIVHELNRLHQENPLLKGWAVCLELLTKRSVDPSEIPSYNPSINPSHAEGGNPSLNPSHAPYSLLPTPNSPTPYSPQRPGAYSAEFEKAWALYPDKKDKKVAAKAFDKAMKDVALDHLLAGIVRYRDDPNREERYTKHFSTWLNAGSWDNDPLPGTKQKPTPIDRVSATRAMAAEAQAQYEQKQLGA